MESKLNRWRFAGLTGIFPAALALILAAYARWPDIPHPYLWLDEAWRAYAVSSTQGVRAFLAYMSGNNEVLLFSEWVLGKASCGIWGGGAWAFRVWPFLFSLVAVAGMVALVRRAGQAELAFLPAWIVAGACGFVYHSREFKPYALDLALTLWLLWAALRAVERRRVGGLVIGLAVMAGASLAFIFVYPAILAFWMIRVRPIRVKPLLALMAPPVLFLATYVLFLHPQNPGGTNLFWRDYYLTSISQSITLIQRYSDFISPYCLFDWRVMTVLLFVVLPMMSIPRRDGLWVLFLLPVGVQIGAASLRIYPFLQRPSHFLFGIMNAGAAVALGLLIDRIAGRAPLASKALKYGVILLALGVSVGGGSFRQNLVLGKTWPPDTARRSMEILAREFQADDRLYVNAPDYYTFLYHRSACFPPGHPLRSAPVVRDFFDSDQTVLRGALRRYAAGEPVGRRLWFLSGYYESAFQYYVPELERYGAPEVRIAERHQTLVSIEVANPIELNPSSSRSTP